MARRKGPSSRACAAVRMRSSVGCELALREGGRSAPASQLCGRQEGPLRTGALTAERKRQHRAHAREARAQGAPRTAAPAP